jgi:hypothetical protein
MARSTSAPTTPTPTKAAPTRTPTPEAYKKLSADYENAANEAKYWKYRFEELEKKRGEDAAEFELLKTALRNLGRLYNEEKAGRISAGEMAAGLEVKLEKSGKKVQDLEVANASLAGKLMREEEASRAQLVELKVVQGEKLELVTKLKVAEEALKESKRLNNEHSNAAKDNARLKRENQALSNTNRGLLAEDKVLKATNQDLNKKLAQETKAHELNYEKWKGAEDKLKLAMYCLEFLAPIRRRWMLSPLQGSIYDAQKEEGNRAAHWPKLLVDIGLFSLGLFGESDRPHFKRMYDFDLEGFMGSHSDLQPLIKTPKVVDLVDMRGAMVAFFALGGSLSIRDVDERFLDSEAICKGILEELYKQYHSKDKAREVYGTNSTAIAEHEKMRALVRQMHILHKTRQNRQQDSSTAN